ncbi:GNAT family N-acetyltransferase [Gymnodinialimonas sp.]
MTLAETLAALHAASFPRGWSAHEFEALLANPTTHAVTSPHGFALMQIIAPEAELITISILPTARGQGHGRALLGQAIQAAQKHGATTMYLEVEADNTAALALYTAAGFETTGRRAGYYAYPDQDAVDAITMACALQSGT